MTDMLDTVRRVQAPTFGLTKFADPLRIPPVLRPRLWNDHVTVAMRRARVRLHSQLPLSTVWAYDGEFPGPTFEVRRDRPVRVHWVNEIDGTIPLVGVQVRPGHTNEPGYDRTLADARLLPEVAALPAWTVVHLHGQRTGGGNDGWPNNAMLPGNTQLVEYPNAQRATQLWYHDHGMDITRFNVLAGLAGQYLIRDDEEHALGLPDGAHEIPLTICDRNLDTDEAGNLTGQLLFKVAGLPGTTDLNTDVLPFTGPFTLVNGTIWPHLEVSARWYRFRVLNASNSRFYTLDLIDEHGRSVRDAVHQIGTDGGLLPAPIPLPEAGLTVAPSERADLLIDFRALRGRSLRLTNLAPLGVEPDIMQFRVREHPAHEHFTLPERLSRSYYRVRHGDTLPEDHDHRWVALVPPGTSGDAHPQLWELAELAEPPRPAPGTAVVDGVFQLVDADTGKLRTFQRVAKMFHDTTTFFLDHDRWAVWNFVHLGGPVHPMHIHLTEFQALSRTDYRTGTFDIAAGGTPLTAAGPVVPDGAGVLQRYEEGWKDTIQVGPNTVVSVAGRFGGATGNFVYHCHILDHEDEGMMRPFVVRPVEVGAFGMHDGEHHH